MKTSIALSATTALAAILSLSSGAAFGHGVETKLRGYQEAPSVSTTASGRFKARINESAQTIDYELRFADLEGAVTQAHIHIGQRGVSGGVSIWLCGTGSNPGPVGTPPCGGPTDGTVTGTLVPSGVVGPAGQGIAAGEFAELVAAIRAGVAYANVHSTKFPGGEIRGQLKDDD